MLRKSLEAIDHEAGATLLLVAAECLDFREILAEGQMPALGGYGYGTPLRAGIAAVRAQAPGSCRHSVRRSGCSVAGSTKF